MKTWRTAIATSATLATAFVVAASAPQSGALPVMSLVNRDGYQGYGPARLALSGPPVKGLYPGAVEKIQIRVANPFKFPLRIRSLGGHVAGSSRRGCPATSASLRVTDYQGSLPIVVQPYSHLALPGYIAVAMPREATPRCSNTRFVITLDGVGDRGPR